MNQQYPPFLDTRSLRDALGEFATGVAVVTARAADGQPVGVTINSFASVSLEPPLVLWSLGLQSPSLAAFESCSHYAVNILAADRLMSSPQLYATFLLWLLSELFEEMPEVGDPEKPKLVFFFDEAHLLFDDAPLKR